MGIPFVDLKAQYRTIKPEIDEAISSVMEDAAFVRGKYVDRFEKAYAAKYGVKHCISVGNGTDAIYVTLKALGLGPGDEVITTALTWISTAETVTQTGARVVFGDIDPDYYGIDPARIEAKITSRTRAVIAVHLYGQPAAIKNIKALCAAHNLYLIEDCAQAHFAEYEGRKVGTFGIAGTFSFYPSKNLGAYGDAGAIITNDDRLGSKMRRFANHGALGKHDHEIEGINSRMDGLQAAILSVKLKHIDEWNQKRYQNALLYNEQLKDVEGIVIPKKRPNASHIFHLYVIRTKARDDLADYLKKKGVGTGIHYPAALPFLSCYEYLGGKPEDFPVAYQYQNEILSLPMYPELEDPQIRRVAGLIEAFRKKTG